MFKTNSSADHCAFRSCTWPRSELLFPVSTLDNFRIKGISSKQLNDPNIDRPFLFSHFFIIYMIISYPWKCLLSFRERNIIRQDDSQLNGAYLNVCRGILFGNVSSYKKRAADKYNLFCFNWHKYWYYRKFLNQMKSQLLPFAGWMRGSRRDGEAAS